MARGKLGWGEPAARMSLRQRNPHWREAQRPEDAPALWRRVTHAAQSCSVLRALAALQAASPEEVEEAQRCASLGLIVPAIRAAGARKTKTSAPPAELLAFVELALQRGFSPDASCPQVRHELAHMPSTCPAHAQRMPSACPAHLPLPLPLPSPSPSPSP